MSLESCMHAWKLKCKLSNQVHCLFVIFTVLQITFCDISLKLNAQSYYILSRELPTLMQFNYFYIVLGAVCSPCVRMAFLPPSKNMPVGELPMLNCP